MERQIFLPHRQRRGGDDLGGARLRRRLTDDHAALIAQALRVEHRLPVEAGHGGGELRDGHRVVTLFHLPQLGAIPMDLRDLLFEVVDALRRALRVGLARHAHHVGDIGDVLGPRLGELGIILEVIVLVRQAQTALADVDGIDGVILQVLLHTGADRHIDAVARRVAEGAGEIGLRIDRGDLREIGLERRGAGLFDRGRVHEARIGVADLGGDGIATGVGGGVFDHLAGTLVGQVAQDREAAPARPVGRDLGAGHPGAVDVIVEVVARRDALVHRGQVDAEAAELRLAGGCGRGGCDRTSALGVDYAGCSGGEQESGDNRFAHRRSLVSEAGIGRLTMSSVVTS